MSNQTSAPPGYGAVTPWVISRDTARLIDFVQAAFGAEELARIPGPAGGIGHAEVRIGDCVVMMFDARASHLRGAGVTPCGRAVPRTRT